MQFCVMDAYCCLQLCYDKAGKIKRFHQVNLHACGCCCLSHTWKACDADSSVQCIPCTVHYHVDWTRSQTCLMLHCHAVLPYATLPCYCATVCLLLRGIASALPDASQAFLICHANKVFWANTAVPSHRHAYIRMTHMHCVMDDRSCSGTVSPLPCLAFMTAAVLLSSLHTFTYSLCNDALQPTTGVLKCLWPAST